MVLLWKGLLPFTNRRKAHYSTKISWQNLSSLIPFSYEKYQLAKFWGHMACCLSNFIVTSHSQGNIRDVCRVEFRNHKWPKISNSFLPIYKEDRRKVKTGIISLSHLFICKLKKNTWIEIKASSLMLSSFVTLSAWKARTVKWSTGNFHLHHWEIFMNKKICIPCCTRLISGFHSEQRYTSQPLT